MTSIEPWIQLVSWAEGALLGDASARDALWIGVFEVVEDWISRPDFLGGVALRRDGVGDITLMAWERLSTDDFRRLRELFERPSFQKTSPGYVESRARHFRNWLRLVTRTVTIDYQRSLPEYVRHAPRDESRAAENSEARYWRSIVTISSRNLAVKDPITLRLRAQECLDFLDRWVSEQHRQALAQYEARTPWPAIAQALGVEISEAETIVERTREHVKYRAAIELWAKGLDFGDIATALQLKGLDDVDRLIRAAKRVLRHHFRHQQPA